MGNFAENLNLGNRFRPPPGLHQKAFIKYQPLFTIYHNHTLKIHQNQ